MSKTDEIKIKIPKSIFKKEVKTPKKTITKLILSSIKAYGNPVVLFADIIDILTSIETIKKDEELLYHLIFTSILLSLKDLELNNEINLIYDSFWKEYKEDYNNLLNKKEYLIKKKTIIDNKLEKNNFISDLFQIISIKIKTLNKEIFFLKLNLVFNNQLKVQEEYKQLISVFDLNDSIIEMKRDLNSFSNKLNKINTHTVSKILTPTLGSSIYENFIGREKELDKIDELLEKKSAILLLNGIGGIGKSSLAINYLLKNKENYDYYGYIESDSDSGLESSFLASLKESVFPDRKSVSFDDILNKIINLEGEKILVIDNISNVEENIGIINKFLSLKEEGFKVIFTSRESIDSIETHFIDSLSEEDSIALFISIYPIENHDILKEILEYIDYHTLFIEITAKTLKKNKGLTPKILIEKFKIGEFPTIRKTRMENFSLYLDKLFSFDGMNEDSTLILREFSILPSIEIEFKVIKDIFTPEDNEDFDFILEELFDLGWLIKREDNYKLHQIIKEFIIYKHKVKYDDVKKHIGNLNLLTKNRLNENYINAYRYIIIVESVLSYIKDENSETAILMNNLSLIYENFNKYQEAEAIQLKALSIRKDLYGVDHPETGNSYHNLALIYQSQGKLEEALELQLKDIEILKKYEPKNLPSSFNNLSTIYQKLGKLDVGMKAIQDAIQIQESLDKEDLSLELYYTNLAQILHKLGDIKTFLSINLELIDKMIKEKRNNHPEIIHLYTHVAIAYKELKEFSSAISYVNKGIELLENLNPNDYETKSSLLTSRGMIYYNIEKFKEAENDLLKAITFLSKIHSNDFFRFGNLYNNISLIYRSLEDYNKAKRYIERSIIIREKEFDEYHPDLANSYNNLGLVLIELKEYRKAIKFFAKSIRIAKENYKNGHVRILKGHISLSKSFLFLGDIKNMDINLNILVELFEKYKPFLTDVNIKEINDEIKEIGDFLYK